MSDMNAKLEEMKEKALGLFHNAKAKKAEMDSKDQSPLDAFKEAKADHDEKKPSDSILGESGTSNIGEPGTEIFSDDKL